ncbi:hypothetical protein NC653_017846 [Populus alba x Populus x berolinensis]|uniref:Uncharacterized protein n=1 Tax=Populus alba x Populus x berolinensis TaxID=444605 RepID=A0AAD6QRA2_9ROSI|nr:hypothetical protein NC653_017846 [Populus alba x Populus x berolinensis]
MGAAVSCSYLWNVTHHLLQTKNPTLFTKECLEETEEYDEPRKRNCFQQSLQNQYEVRIVKRGQFAAKILFQSEHFKSLHIKFNLQELAILRTIGGGRRILMRFSCTGVDGTCATFAPHKGTAGVHRAGCDGHRLGGIRIWGSILWSALTSL